MDDGARTTSSAAVELILDPCYHVISCQKQCYRILDREQLSEMESIDVVIRMRRGTTITARYPLVNAEDPPDVLFLTAEARATYYACLGIPEPPPSVVRDVEYGEAGASASGPAQSA